MKNKTNSKHKILGMMKPLDAVVIILILILSFSVSAAVTSIYSGSPQNQVVVQKNGEVIFKLSETELGKDGIYAFQFGEETGYLEVAARKVRMLPMERRICPEAICSDTGWIARNPTTIACLPNKLVVAFTGTTGAELDGVSF